MCYNEIEKFGCGHEEKHRIPCEDLCENRGCTKTEEDQIREDTGSVCTKCRNDEDETEFIQEELRKFAEQESLNPSAPPPTRTRDPNAPKLFFKRCIVWTKCHHHSHPRPSDIDRDEGDPEYLHVEGIGNCFDCSAAPASTIAKMKQNGDYDKEDPWGAMSRPEIAEGSSRGANLPSLEEIARGVTHAQANQHAQEDALASPPLSPEMSGRPRSAGSLDSDYDVGPAKGKGRLGEPIRRPAAAAIVESGVSDAEDAQDHASKQPVRLSKTTQGNEWEHEDGTADDDDEDEKAGHGLSRSRKLPGRSPSLSDREEKDQGEFSEDEGAHGKVPRWGHSMHHAHIDEEEEEGSLYSDSDEESDTESEDEDGHEDGQYASPEELKAAGLPPTAKMTKVQVQSIMKRKAQEGQKAMTQAREGKIE
ncbi:MAG: hypothetical protein LQ338_002393 [Usnochroma carphineum]|nr:MAG: hypothetical protein LQ338_002393 [Usnochroma carphineum]